MAEARRWKGWRRVGSGLWTAVFWLEVLASGPPSGENGAVKFFDRWRTPDVRADVGSGFWVAEAQSMQRILRHIMASGERRLAVVPARLRFTAGLEGRVVVLWRNSIAGFVPSDRVADLRRQLTEAGDARLVADGEVREHAGLWRVWVGTWPETAVPEPPIDEIAAQPNRILGIPLTGREGA